MKAPCPLHLPYPRIRTAARRSRHRKTKRGSHGTRGRPFDSPHTRNVRGEGRSIKLDNAWALVGFPLSVPVLSCLFDAWGRPSKEPFPVRPLAGTWRPALTAGSARAVHRQPTGLGLGHSCPALRANLFPKLMDPFCRLPLPTLFHLPEVVHLGDLMRL
ncbi:hypothetical protein CQW23_35396 [Capsicum baccatum]|uniref:Uncharacterized protein n=1 Tax=Capsicum baccatum TaxID=33114 RepID=A0A2G2UW24_CAPBA|nr:hypothetical protein CQW23_35396 [Capsicum baccatum]